MTEANTTVNNLQISSDQMAQLTIRALVFDGKNYLEWTPSITNYLTSSDDLKYLTTEITESTDAAVKKASMLAAIKMRNFVTPSIRACSRRRTSTPALFTKT